MIKTSISEAPKVPANLDGYIMHKSDALEVIHLCLKPGQVIPEHPNQYDVVACLVSGEVTLHSGDNQTELTLFDVVEIEKDVYRGFTNSGAMEARLLIIKKL